MRSAPARVCTHGHPLTQRCARGPGPLPPGRTALLHAQLQRGGRGQRGPQDSKSRLAGGMGIRAPPGRGVFLHGGELQLCSQGSISCTQHSPDTGPAHRTPPPQGLHLATHTHGSLRACTHMPAACGPTRTCVPGSPAHTQACTQTRSLTPVHVHGARRVWGEAGDQGSR